MRVYSNKCATNTNEMLKRKRHHKNTNKLHRSPIAAVLQRADDDCNGAIAKDN